MIDTKTTLAEDPYARDIADLNKILSMPEGRRFMWMLINESGFLSTSFTGDTHTYFNEGKRYIGLVIMKILNEANPSAFLQMQMESKADLAARKRQQELEEEADYAN